MDEPRLRPADGTCGTRRRPSTGSRSRRRVPSGIGSPARKSVTPMSTSGGTRVHRSARDRASRRRRAPPAGSRRRGGRRDRGPVPRGRRAPAGSRRRGRSADRPHGIQPLPKRARRRSTAGVDGAADPDRHATRLARASASGGCRRSVSVSPSNVRALLAPQRLAHRQRLVEQRAAAVEVETGGVVLLALPADADAEVEPSAREHVERRRRLRQHDRAPERGEQDVGAETDLVGHRRPRT